MILYLWMKDMIYFLNEKNYQDIYLQLLLKQIQNFSVYRKFTLFLIFAYKSSEEKSSLWELMKCTAHPLRKAGLSPDWACRGEPAR